MSNTSGHQPTIRRASLGDAAALALVGAATFLESYTELVQGPDLVAHVRNRHAEAVYAAWLTDPDICVWIAETCTAAPAGYLVLLPATLPVGSPALERDRLRLTANSCRPRSSSLFWRACSSRLKSTQSDHALGDFEILRIYVLLRYQSTGLGYALMQRAVAESRARGARKLVLGVHKANTKALSFYARQGFEITGRRDFLVGNTIFDDLIVSLNLQME